MRKYLAVADPGLLGFSPSGFESKATHLQVWTSDGQKLAAMRPVDPGSAGVTHDVDCSAVAHEKEFSCRKNWLFPRPPTNGASRFSKKVS
jgi:hypothetical protein